MKRRRIVGRLAVLFTLATIATGLKAQESAPKSPDEGGPRNWQVKGPGKANLREQASVEAGVLATFAAGTVLDNLGCEAAEQRIWCDVQPLGGGPRGYVALDLLQPAVSPNGVAMTGPDDSAFRAGQGRFDATGKTPCAQELGQPTTWCDFGVARAGGGYATVVVTRPDGSRRVLYFRMGRAIGVQSSEADPVGEFRAEREGDLTRIRVGDERYEIPDAVVLGG